MHRIIYLVNIFVAMGLLLSYICPILSPSTLKVVSIFGLFYPMLTFANLFFIFYWLFSKQKTYIFLSLITMLLGLGSYPRFIQFNSESETTSSSLNMMSFNVRGSHLSTDEKEIYNEVSEYFQGKKSIDIYCIQEKKQNNKSVISSIMSDLEMIEGSFGSGIYSRLPIKNSGIVTVGGNTKEAVWADIQISEGQIVRIYNFHLSSNLITKAKDEIIKDPKLGDRKTWSTIEGMLKNYAKYAAMRNKQLDVLLDHSSKSPYPVIFAGDLNDVPQSHAYHRIAKNRSDSFISNGIGFGSTFGGRIPLLRIDYIFADPTLEIIGHKVGYIGFSDHYPIEVKFQLNAP